MKVIHRLIAIVCLSLLACSASNEELAFDNYLVSREAITAGDLVTLVWMDGQVFLNLLNVATRAEMAS